MSGRYMTEQEMRDTVLHLQREAKILYEHFDLFEVAYRMKLTISEVRNLLNVSI
jgi:hypothetical protein